MKTASKPKPVLKQFAQLWTLTHQPSEAKEWSLEEKFRQAKKAGFDALGGRVVPKVAALSKKYGMDYVCYIDSNRKSFREKLEAAQTTRPARINVQLCDHDTPPKEAAAVWIKLEALAQKMGLAVDLEIHRDTATETPEKFYEIAALYQKATGRKIRFCWDFSHPAVIKHLYPPYEMLLERPDLVPLARQLHFRPFNGHHAQIPATDGRGRETREFKDYLQFIDRLLAVWMKGARGGEILYVCPEFGPANSGYGLSTFADVWKDAILLRKRTEELWKSNLRRWRR